MSASINTAPTEMIIPAWLFKETPPALDMQSDLFKTAVKGPTAKVLVQMMQTIASAHTETPIQLGNRIVKPTLADEIKATSEITQQLFAKIVLATYEMITAEKSTAIIAFVLEKMGPELSCQFVQTFALSKAIEFEEQLSTAGLI